MTNSKFKEYFKILRIKHNEVLADSAKFLGVSSAFISGVENGKKNIPDDWFDKITNHYNLNEQEQIELKEAIESSKRQVKLDLSNANQLQREVALSFQRSFDTCDELTLKEIQRLLERK